MLRPMPSASWKSSNRRVPRQASRIRSRFQWSPSTAALRAMVHGQSEVSVRFTSPSVEQLVASWYVVRRVARRARRRRADRPRHGRHGTAQHEASDARRHRRRGRRRCSQDTSRCPTGSAWTTSRRGPATDRRGTQRVHRQRGPRSMGRHAVAQDACRRDSSRSDATSGDAHGSVLLFEVVSSASCLMPSTVRCMFTFISSSRRRTMRTCLSGLASIAIEVPDVPGPMT